jgi:hypothetical protein
MARTLFKADEEVDPSQLSGMLVIAIRGMGKEANGLRQYEVGYTVTRKDASGKKKVSNGGSFTGSVRDFLTFKYGTDGQSAHTSIRSKDGKERRLFEFRLLEKDKLRKK